MLYSLTGILVFYDDSSIAVDCGGVAYLCRATLTTIASLGGVGAKVRVFTHMLIRSEALDLFAFAEKQELECFKMLIGVTGVGPKVALGILSGMAPERFALCVAAGDHKPLTAAPGVGKKLAERIVLELRDKVGGADFSTPQAARLSQTGRAAGNIAEAVSALVVLGYPQTDAALAVADADEVTPVEEIIKAALKKLAKRN